MTYVLSFKLTLCEDYTKGKGNILKIPLYLVGLYYVIRWTPLSHEHVQQLSEAIDYGLYNFKYGYYSYKNA